MYQKTYFPYYLKYPVLIDGTNINTRIATLNCELATLTEWLNANKLSINVS